MKPIILRRLTGVLICMAIIISSTLTVFALDLDEPINETPTDEYQYASDVSANLTISSSGVANFRATAIGQSGVATKITGVCYLQKYNGGAWSNIKSVERTTYSTSLYLNSTKTGLVSGTYRTHAVFYVYSGSNYETITVNSLNKSF